MDRDVGQEEEEGDLAEDGANDVEGLQLNKFIAFEAQVLFETRDVRIICKVLVKSLERGWDMFGDILKLD